MMASVVLNVLCVRVDNVPLNNGQGAIAGAITLHVEFRGRLRLPAASLNLD